jgi:hypothetical protein
MCSVMEKKVHFLKGLLNFSLLSRLRIEFIVNIFLNTLWLILQIGKRVFSFYLHHAGRCAIRRKSLKPNHLSRTARLLQYPY